MKKAEPGSFSPFWPLEVFGLLSYFLEVGVKSLQASQALGAVLGASIIGIGPAYSVGVVTCSIAISIKPPFQQRTV